MVGYCLKRFLEASALLLIISFLIYMLMGLMPGDPLDMLILNNPELTSADIEALKAAYGLDKPLLERYQHWLTQAIFHGNLGYSRYFNMPVLPLLKERFWVSMEILIPALILGVGISFILALWAAHRPSSYLDKSINFLALSSIATPTFWFALLLILVFAVHLGWFPASGVILKNDPSLHDKIKHYSLPVITLAFGMLGTYIRYIRSGVLEALQMPCMMTAKAKGASARRILCVHALRNAALPIITILMLSFGAIFGGALITETIFSVPGMGKMIFDAVSGNDYNVALAGLLFSTAFVIFSNMLADILYAIADPRVRYKKAVS